MEDLTHEILNARHILLFLIQFFILLTVSRLLGLLFKRFRQPTVTADVLTGFFLGPSILGRTLPDLHAMLFPSDPVLKAGPAAMVKFSKGLLVPALTAAWSNI